MKIRLFRWFAQIWHWLGEAKVFFMCILAICSVIMFGFYTWPSEASIRLGGFVLQFIGMICAIRGLLQIREHFGHKPLLECALEWVKRFPKWKENVTLEVDNIYTSQAMTTLNLGTWYPDDPSKSLEQRFEKVVKNIELLRSEQVEHFSDLKELKTSLDEHKKRTAEKTDKIKKDLNSNLESLHTNDLITSLVGLIWLIVGLTLSAMAPELNCFFNAA